MKCTHASVQGSHGMVDKEFIITCTKALLELGPALIPGFANQRTKLLNSIFVGCGVEPPSSKMP